MTKVEIILENGKWLINGKPYGDLNDHDKQFFDEFIIAAQLEKERENHDNQQKKHHELRR